MKHILLGMAVLGLAFGCKSQDSTSVSDPDSAAAPAAGCGMDGGCDMKDGAACDMKDGAACDMKDGAGCDMQAGKTKTCPVTGNVEN